MNPELNIKPKSKCKGNALARLSPEEAMQLCDLLEMRTLMKAVFARGYNARMFEQVCAKVAEETRSGARWNAPGKRYSIHDILRAILRGEYDYLFN